LLQAFADDQGASGGDVTSLQALLALFSPDAATRGAADEALRQFRDRAEATPPVWADQDPMARSAIGPDVPADVTSQLQMVRLDLEVPAAWRSTDAKVCTRSSVGWNICFDLGNSELYHEDRVDLAAFVYRDEPLEVWLKPPDGPVHETVGLIGIVAPEHFSGDQAPLLTASDQARSASSLGQLRALIDQGAPLVTVTGVTATD
jgi:hypothetical protein